MSNKKVLSKATRELNKTKRLATPKDIIEDPRGQWAHPGEITRIPSDNITMQGVPYPVMAYPNIGEPQMMYPGGEYNFPGADYVDEYPELKKGGTPKSLVRMPKPSKKGLASKKFSSSLDATNKIFTEHFLFKQPKSRKRKVFDPSAEYKKGGALLTKNVTCKKCGWEWDAADGGDDITTCHKCGSQGLVHAQDGGESGCPEGYAFNPITGECIEWNPTVWNSEEEPTSYDPVGDIVYMNPNDRPEGMSDEEYAQMYQDQIEHEQLHRLQWINGELKGESKTPLRMPSTVDNQQYDGEHYYNRRGEEEKYLHDIWNQRNPELAKFLPEDMVYNKEVNPLMYNIPWTEEGEARGYEGAVHNGMESIFPKRKEGGAMSPKDLDPEQMKRYLADLRIQENGIKKGFKNGKWYPHGSVEGGADTIAYGHKLTPNESYLRKGITEDAALQLQQGDVLKNQALAKKQVDKKYGAGTFDKLPQDSQMLLVDYQYNLGSLSGFPSFVDATVKGDKDKMLAQHTRYGAGKPLTKRNNWTVDVINNMGIPKPYDPMQVTIPQANVPDATNVVQPIIFPGPDESIELELTPEEIKEYQMGGYTVEDVEDTNEAAMPCSPGYIFDPRIGRCVPENSYRLSRASVKDNINVDDALRENKRYYEGYEFMKDWQNSPMYNKMLKKGARNSGSYEYLRKMRQKQLDSTPPLQILPQPEGKESTAGQSWTSTGQIEIFPAGFGTRGTASHELSHSADRPVEGTDLRLIPQRDVEYINNNKAKTIGDSRSYHNYKDMYDPWFKEDPEYKEQVDDDFKSFYSDYVGEPTEVRARLNEIRQTAKESGLYDPFTEGVTPDLYYKKLKNFKYEKGDKSGFDGMKQLQDAFSDEEIIWMLNNISKTEDNKEELNTAQDGGSVYTYAGRPGSYYQKRGSKWYISNSGTNGEYVPLQDADGKRTALLNKSAVKVMSNPTTSKEEKYKNLPAYSNSPMVASVKGKTEAERKQVDDAIYTQNLIAKMRADTAESQKNALPQHEQPLVAQDWIWTLPMMGGSAMKSAGTAIADGMGAVGTKVMPYVTGALETSLPFMKSIPGATVGNALGAGFAADAVVNRLPKVPGQIARGEYMDAAENVITGGLDVLGAGVVSPLYEGARGAMSGLKKFIGTEEGLLSRINDVPVELPGSVNNSANVNKGVLESIVEGVSRTKERDALNSLELQSLNETQLGQGNAMDLFDDFKREKLADLETPEGNRRIQKYIDDNQLGQTVWDNGNYEEEFNRIEKTVDASSPEVLTFIEGIKERAKVANVSPQDMGYSKIKSWDELTPEFVTNDLKARLHLVDEIVRKSPDFTGTDKLIPITTDDYIKQFKKMSYEDVQDKFQQRMIQVKTTNDKLDLLKTEERKLRKAFDEGKISIREFGPGLTSVKKNIQVSQDNLRAFQRQATALKDKLNLDNASFSYGNQVFIGNPYTTVGDLKQTMQHEAAGHGLNSPFLEIDKDAMVVKNSALDKELINGLDLKKRTPKHLLRKINVKEVSEAAPYNVTRLGIERAKNPKYYFRAAKNYFQKGNTGISGMSQEPVAFAAEVRNSLRERNVIGSDYDNITPEMLEQHYNEYIESPLYERNLRLFDIMDPTKKSFKVLSGVLNNMKAVAPYAVPVGIGVGAASGSEELQEEMQYQDGGIIMELSDDEIQQYANGGFIVEELDYKPNAGKTLNKKETPAPNVATIPKININTEGLSYKPSASAKPQNKNPKPVVKPKPQETVKVEKVKPEVTTDSMTTILDKYAIGDTSPIMTTNVFQDIFAKQDMEKQAKIEKLRRQIEASQNQIKKQGTSTYKYQEELIEGMPNIRTTESESYLQGSPLKNEVKKVVLHHTGTIDEKNNNKYVHNHFMNPKSETSSHIVIEEDGLRTIYASPDQVTFHAGKSSWDGRSNVNDFGIGVEFQGDTNLKPLTDAQIESFVEYFDQLAKQYKISTKDIITHAMVAPGRKPDITEREYKKILKYLKDKGYK